MTTSGPTTGRPATDDPDVLRRQIEDTRRDLSYDVEALNEKVNPARVVDRRVTAVKGRVTRLKDQIMGGADDTATSAQYMASRATDSMGDAVSNAAGAVQEAPRVVARHAQGNPLAAGLIAFGVGWLVSSLIPPSEKERELAQQAESALREHKDTLLEPVKEAGQEISEQLKPAAQQAVEEVKSTAQQGAEAVKDEGQAATQQVQGKAKQAKESVQGAASGS